MTTFLVTVVIETDTPAHAHQVIAERLGYDEILSDESGVEFNYSVDSLNDLRPLGVNEETPGQRISVHGNPFDGYTFHGPFPTFDAAVEYEDRAGVAGDWWVGDLYPPNHV